MIKKLLLLSMLLYIPSTALLGEYTEPEDIEEESMHNGHDYYRKQAIQKAKQSEQNLITNYEEVIKLLKENPLTDEEEHNLNILEFVEQNQKDWRSYRYSFCHTQALIEIYPSTSRLFSQVVNSCLSELNTKRIKYLNNLKREIKQ